MKNSKSYASKEGEVRELDQHFFAKAKRGRPAMPEQQRKLRVNLMLDQDVIAGLKAKGNMSAEANSALREALTYDLPPVKRHI